jgi:uncharacterized RDD family membrane protein YckC
MESSSARNLLDRSELLEVQYQPATHGQRLANWIIDVICVYILIFSEGVVAGLFKSLLDIDFTDWLGLATLLTYVAYWTLLEWRLGKTVGKMVTKTRVIDEDGQLPSFWQAFGRFLGRLIPFDAISVLGSSVRAWHDRVAETWVVQDIPLSQPLSPTDPGPETE